MRPQGRQAISPVIATVILSGTVLVIGGAIWAYSIGATTVIADSYVEDTLSLVNEIIERFDVEHVQYRYSNHTLRVWIYNYGEVGVTVDVYITAKTTISKEKFSQIILSEQVKRVSFDFSSSALTTGDDVVIKVYSRRQNIAYLSFVVQ